MTFDRGSVTGNSAAKEGGGLWNSPQGTMTVTHVKIKGNSAPVGANVFNQPPGGTFTDRWGSGSGGSEHDLTSSHGR